MPSFGCPAPPVCPWHASGLRLPSRAVSAWQTSSPLASQALRAAVSLQQRFPTGALRDRTVIGSRSAPSASRCRALTPQPAALQSLTPRSRGRSRGCGDRGGGTPVPGGGLLDARVGSLIGAGPPSARRSPPPLPARAGLPSSQGKVRLCVCASAAGPQIKAREAEP